MDGEKHGDTEAASLCEAASVTPTWLCILLSKSQCQNQEQNRRKKNFKICSISRVLCVLWIISYNKKLRRQAMGMVREEIILRNARDVNNAQSGITKESDIHEKTVAALVDTGAITLVISEATRQELGLLVMRSDFKAKLADGSPQNYALSEPVQIVWKNREAACQAIVVPGAENTLLGSIPLEALDLIVDPVRQVLTGAHGEEQIAILC
jgi:predicted aspartyl protease